MKLTASNVSFPDKFFYKIGEVSKIVGVEPHVLRYWEKEFGFDKLKKLKTKQRQYQKKDIFKFLEIKKLLYEKKYTIEGAKKILKKSSKKVIDKDFLISELQEIKNLLTNEPYGA